MRRTTFAAILVSLCCLVSGDANGADQAASSTASMAVIDASDLESGRHAVIVHVEEDGSISVEQIRLIVRLNGDGVPDPPDDPDDPPDDPESLSEKAEAWARSVGDKPAANNLSQVYRQVANWIDNGTVPTAEGARQAFDLAKGLVLAEAEGDWDPFFDRVDDVVDPINDASELENAYRQISEGLKAASQ